MASLKVVISAVAMVMAETVSRPMALASASTTAWVLTMLSDVIWLQSDAIQEL